MIYHYNKTSRRYDIVVVCEQTFYVLNEADGKIRYQRRLEYSPSCLRVYHAPGQNKDIFENEERSHGQVMSAAISNTHDSPCFSFILGSFSHYLMVYKDVQLVWTAKTQTAPIYVNITRVEQQEGLMVTLSDSGYLQVVFLGTEAPTQQVHSEGSSTQQEKSANYDEMSIEH
jgi:hypothetical protein